MSRLAAKAIEAALNRYLSLDPDGPRGLSALQGRWVALDVDGKRLYVVSDMDATLSVFRVSA